MMEHRMRSVGKEKPPSVRRTSTRSGGDRHPRDSRAGNRAPTASTSFGPDGGSWSTGLSTGSMDESRYTSKGADRPIQSRGMADRVTCELCGVSVPPHAHYIVRIDVFADPS